LSLPAAAAVTRSLISKALVQSILLTVWGFFISLAADFYLASLPSLPYYLFTLYHATGTSVPQHLEGCL